MFQVVLLGAIAPVAIACQPQLFAPSEPTDLPQQTSGPVADDTAAPEPQIERRQYDGIRFNFRFEHPAEYFVETTLPPETGDRIPLERVDLWNRTAYTTLQLEAPNPAELPPNLSVTVYPNPQQLSLEEWVLQTGLGGDSPEAIRELTVAGQEAIAFFASGQYETENVVVASPDRAELVLVTLAKETDSEAEAAYRFAFREVVSTLRFGRQRQRVGL